MIDLPLPRPAEELIPHRLPMRLVDELCACAGGGATVAATVRGDGPLTDAEGRLEAAGLIEMLAQSFAALQGYEDQRRGRPVRKGFLVGVSSFAFTGTAHVGDRLRIELRTVANLGGFAMAEGEIWRKERSIARGALKLWIADESEATD
ncbi:MAG: hypothetical protein WDA20_00505 [Desulfuromonadales bacterium]